MANNVILMGWNRPLPGREPISGQHFQDLVEFLGGLQQNGKIESFEPVFLNPHGGDLNGFFLIRGTSYQIAELLNSAEWTTHMTRASLHLDGAGAIPGVNGEMLMARMAEWEGLIPS
jgi:hypothetical protein